MSCRASLSVLLLSASLILLAGCAATRHELAGPPSVQAAGARPDEIGAAPAVTEPDLPEAFSSPEADLAGADSGGPGGIDLGSGEDPVSESPLDQLAAATPELSPEQLEEKRELVTAEVPTFDIPVEINDQVLAWVDLYSRRHQASFESGLARSGRYMDLFRRIFEDEGLPRDLVYMAHVESGYKTTAYSRAHARGIFQFIASTARKYGLRVDYWVDERADPEKSARAAAHYMKDLYAEFGDWYLAFAAYNAGEGTIRRALARSGKRDFWGIARTRYIRRETKNHVPAILAATLLSKEPDKYGLSFVPDPPLRYDTIVVEGAADLRVLARCAGSELTTLRELNPALRRSQTPPDGRTELRLPEGTGEAAAAALAAIAPAERVLYARHRVRRGDTLSTIARRYGVSVGSIQQTNGMGRRTLIRVNQVLLVPTSTAAAYGGASALADDVPGAGKVLVYRVRRGDTLYGISRRYGTTAGAIAAASGIAVDDTLRIGARLRVVPGVRSASAAARIAVGGAEVAANRTSDRGSVVHTVRRGDTLWAIANLYRTSVAALCALNQISPTAILRPGLQLTVGFE